MRRRQFIAASATLAASPVLAAPPGIAGQQAIIHHVFFWLKEPGNAAHAQQLKKGLAMLRQIPQVKQLWIGGPAGTEKRDVVDHSYQVSELMFFDSIADQAAYQDHPVHQAFVQQYSQLWQKVVVYDVLAEKSE